MCVEFSKDVLCVEFSKDVSFTDLFTSVHGGIHKNEYGGTLECFPEENQIDCLGLHCTWFTGDTN